MERSKEEAKIGDILASPTFQRSLQNVPYRDLDLMMQQAKRAMKKQEGVEVPKSHITKANVDNVLTACKDALKVADDVQKHKQSTTGASLSLQDAEDVEKKQQSDAIRSWMALQRWLHPECGNCGRSCQANRCTKCNLEFYCNRTCQVRHWKDEHKRTCTRPEVAPRRIRSYEISVTSVHNPR